MHPIFYLEEIVEEMISWLSRGDQAAAARVNSMWFRSALPVLWREVDLPQALRPLGVWSQRNRRGIELGVSQFSYPPQKRLLTSTMFLVPWRDANHSTMGPLCDIFIACSPGPLEPCRQSFTRQDHECSPQNRPPPIP